MISLYLLFALKILQLVGATLNTLGFLTFFTFASLAPYRWHLILGGIATIAVSEVLTRLWVKKHTGPFDDTVRGTGDTPSYQFEFDEQDEDEELEDDESQDDEQRPNRP